MSNTMNNAINKRLSELNAQQLNCPDTSAASTRWLDCITDCLVGRVAGIKKSVTLDSEGVEVFELQRAGYTMQLHAERDGSITMEDVNGIPCRGFKAGDKLCESICNSMIVPETT